MNTPAIKPTVTVPRTLPKWAYRRKDEQPAAGPLAWAKNRNNVKEIVVGRRYLELRALSQIDPAELQQDDDRIEHAFIIPAKDELSEALADAKQEIIDLQAFGIFVEEWCAFLNRFVCRKPKLGDIVEVPRDIWTDSESNGEPEEDRMPEVNTGLPFGCNSGNDLVGGFVTLADILDDRNAMRLARQCDRFECGRVTAALRILSEHGDISGDGFVASQLYPGPADQIRIRDTTVRIASKIRLISGKKPSDAYWAKWCEGVRVFIEIPAKEWLDNNRRMTIWSPIP